MSGRIGGGRTQNAFSNTGRRRLIEGQRPGRRHGGDDSKEAGESQRGIGVDAIADIVDLDRVATDAFGHCPIHVSDHRRCTGFVVIDGGGACRGGGAVHVLGGVVGAIGQSQKRSWDAGSFRQSLGLLHQVSEQGLAGEFGEKGEEE